MNDKFFTAWFVFVALVITATLGGMGYLLYLGIQVADKYLNG
jgi:hypothetical protein